MNSLSRKIYIKTNFDRCTGCALCQLACTERFLSGYNPHRALLRITHECENLYHFPTVCSQCDNAYCAAVCPVTAIERNETTGAWVVNEKKCVACGLCRRYCPLQIVGVDPELKKSVKCDLCGGEPACVAACPTRALELAWCENHAGTTGGD